MHKILMAGAAVLALSIGSASAYDNGPRSSDSMWGVIAAGSVWVESQNHSYVTVGAGHALSYTRAAGYAMDSCQASGTPADYQCTVITSWQHGCRYYVTGVGSEGDGSPLVAWGWGSTADRAQDEAIKWLRSKGAETWSVKATNHVCVD